MKKICGIVLFILFVLFPLLPPKSFAFENYTDFWSNLPGESKLVLLTAYLRGHHDGASGFGFVYKKLFNKTLSLEDLHAVDKVISVPGDKLIQVRSNLLDFMEFVYKDNEYSHVNVYDMMAIGVTCSRTSLSPKECLFLFGDRMKAIAQ